MLYNIDINTLTGSISAKEKSLLYSTYDGVADRAPLLTLGLRMSVHPAKPTSPIKLLREQIPKIYDFDDFVCSFS